MIGATRYPCPLACGWHYDQPASDPIMLAEARPDLTTHDIAYILISGQTQQAEQVLREHCESHPLEEWVMALTTAQRERDRIAAELDTERRQAQAVRDWMQVVAYLGAPASGAEAT